MTVRSASCAIVIALAIAATTHADDLPGVLAGAVEPRLASMQIPGAAVAVVREGEVVLLEGYGTSDPRASTPVDPVRDVFRVGSVSKPVTATALLLLAAEGRIGLDDDVRPLLDKFTIEPPLAVPLTLHQLLTHTAGFNERLFGQHTAIVGGFFPLGEYLQQHLPPRFIEPGLVIAYNDHHTALAGRVLEILDERTFAAAVDARVFAPLGMTSSTFEQIALPRDIETRITRAWHKRGDGFEPYARDYVQTTPAAGLYTNAADMAKYLRALLDCNASPLGASVCVQLDRQFGHHARLPGRTYGFAESRHAGMRVLFKDGQASGFNARLLLIPEARFGLFVVHNRSILGAFGAFEPAARFNREVASAVLDALWPPPVQGAVERPVAAPGARERAQAYAGSYRTVIAARHTWERLASLFDDFTLTATERGVRLKSGEYVEIEPGLLQWHEGGERYLALRVVDGRATHAFLGGGAYERVPWFLSSAFTPWLLAILVAALVATLVFVVRARAWSTLGASAAANIILLAFLAGVAAVFALADPQAFFQGPPLMLQMILVLPITAIACIGAQIWQLRGAHSPRARVAAALNAVPLVGLLAWLDYWNLLGWRFGRARSVSSQNGFIGHSVAKS